MFANELQDLGSNTRGDLLEAGLHVGGLDGDGAVTAFWYAEGYLTLSNNDAFALALANTADKVLLAGDGALREAAARKTSSFTATCDCRTKWRNTEP